jgi:NAD(P) transhydrogenase subunit beta
LTFTGSVIAFAKLSGRMSGKPIMLPMRHVINLALGALRCGRRARSSTS